MDATGKASIKRLVVCACLVLASCGGGGGDEGGTTPPPPPAGLQPLSLEPSRVGDYFDLTFSFFSTARSFAEIGVAGYQTFAQSGPEPITFSCLSGGSVTISLQDNDGSNRISAGDRVQLRYAACASPESTLDAVLNVDFHTIEVQGGGPISIARVKATAAGSPNRLVFDVTVASFSDVASVSTIALSGGVAVTYTFSADEDHFLINSEALASSETFTGGSQVLTLRDASYDYRLDNGLLRFELSLDGRIDIEGADTQGYFTFDTGTALGGLFNNTAGSGAITLHGAEDGYIRLEPDQTDASASNLRFYYSDNGTEEHEEEGHWGSIPAFPQILPLQDGIAIPSSTQNYEDPQPLTGRRVDLGAVSFDMAVDRSRSAIYISVPERNEIVVVSSVYMNVVDRIRVGSRPSGMDISRDGSTLYVANEGNGTISAIDLDSHATQSIDVQGVLGSAHARDVVESTPGVLFVVGGSRPLIDQFDQQDIVIRVDRNAGNEMHRVAVDRLVDDAARLYSDLAGRYVFVSDKGLLLQLDAADPGAPVLKAHTGSSREEHIEFSPDGTHVLTWNEALELDTLEPDPDYPLLKGVGARWNLDGSQLWTQVEFTESLIDVINTRAAVRIGRYTHDCFTDDFFPMTYRSGGGGTWAFLQRQTLCLVSTLSLDQAPGVESDPPPAPTEVPAETKVLPLDWYPSDLVIDEVRHRAYLSVSGNIVVVDTQNVAIVDTFPITEGGPYSLALSEDGNTLYVGLTSPQGIGYFDLSSKSMDHVLDLTSDFPFLEYPVVETVGPDRIIVSAGWALPGLLDLRPSDDSYQIIASSIQSSPTVAVAPDKDTLYVGTFITEPTQLWSVDLSAAPPAITSAGDAFSHTYGRYISVSPDGERLYLEHGVILDSTTFRQIGVLGDGQARPEANGQKARMAMHLAPVANPEPLTLATYDTHTMSMTEFSQTQCIANDPPTVYSAEGGARWLMFSDDHELCVVTPGN